MDCPLVFSFPSLFDPPFYLVNRSVERAAKPNVTENKRNPTLVSIFLHASRESCKFESVGHLMDAV